MNQNKIALVTGGSRGLGKNMALKLAHKELDVILTYNTKKEEAESVVNEIKEMGQKAIALQLNVAEVNNFNDFIDNTRAILKELFDAEKIDYLVNNAGISGHHSFSTVTGEQFDELLNIHLRSCLKIKD